MDGKKHKHAEIFKMLEPEMEKQGYTKTADQMKLKLKNLKLAYFKCRRDNSVSGAATSCCAFYNELELLYGIIDQRHKLVQAAQELIQLLQIMVSFPNYFIMIF